MMGGITEQEIWSHKFYWAAEKLMRMWDENECGIIVLKKKKYPKAKPHKTNGPHIWALAEPHSATWGHGDHGSELYVGHSVYGQWRDKYPVFTREQDVNAYVEDNDLGGVTIVSIPIYEAGDQTQPFNSN